MSEKIEEGGFDLAKERKLRVAVAQPEVMQGDVKANLDKAKIMIKEAAENKADIICFPELYYQGYHLEAEELQLLAETQDGEMVQALSKLARENKIYVIVGYAEAVEIPGRMYNSAIFISDQGEVIGNMRKVNAWGQEKLKFREGNDFPVYDTPIGKIGLMICYDVEMPEPARILALKGAELVFVPVVWSNPAEDRWHIFVPANALFNVYFMAGSNTCGHETCGSSMIVHPSGRILAEAGKSEEIIYSDIDLEDVVKERARLPYLNDFKEEFFSMDAVK